VHKYSSLRSTAHCAAADAVPHIMLQPMIAAARLMKVFYVCLSVCPLDFSKSYKWMLANLFGAVVCGPQTSQSDFGGDLDHDPEPRFLGPIHDLDPGMF